MNEEHGLLVQSNAEMDRDANAQQAAVDLSLLPIKTSLAGHIDAVWSANQSARQSIETIMVKCLRDRAGEFDPDVLTRMKAQGITDPVFMMIPDIKCRAAIAWLREAMLPPGEVPFRIEPTPVPDLPAHMYEAAKVKVAEQLQQKLMVEGKTPDQLSPIEFIKVGDAVKAELKQWMDERALKDCDTLSNHMNDALVEGGWYEALHEFIDDFVTFPTAFIKGPCYRYKTKIKWDGSQITPKRVLIKSYQRVSPFDLFPSSGARTLDDGNLIERIIYSPADLQDVIGVEGYDDGAIREVLELYSIGGISEQLSIDDQVDSILHNDSRITDPSPKIEALKFYGDVQGKMLSEWGMQGIEDDTATYSVVCIKVSQYVIYAQINQHPLHGRGYYGASFIRQPGSIWGRSVTMVLGDITRLANSSANALARNMGIASGPQSWINVSRLDPSQIANASVQYPWKVTYFNDGNFAGRTDAPMGWFMPPSVASELLNIYKFFYDQASEITGIPAYTYGSDKVGGAGRTASGLEMLLESAAKGLRESLTHIDEGIIKPSVRELHINIMMFEPEKAMGDINIVPRASEYLMQMGRMQQSVNEALAATANPVDMEIIKTEGRAELLREYFTRLKIPGIDRIVPSRDSLSADAVQQQVQMVIMRIAQALGMPPEQLMAILQQQAQPGGRPQQPQQMIGR